MNKKEILTYQQYNFKNIEMIELVSTVNQSLML